MSTGPVATATVKIIPDTSGFRAALQAEIAAATAGVGGVGGVGGGRGGGGGGGSSFLGGGRASKQAADGLKATTAQSNALRGSLIGLSRVTPVTVFGLGLYGTAAIAAGYSIKSAIRSTADFEHQLYTFQAVTQATAEEMTRISEEAKRLGADLSLPSTSAGDAARAMTQLAKGGLTVDETLAASRGTLQLAAAAQLEVGTAAEFVVTQLNAFGLAGDRASHIADLLAGASIAAQGDIADFGNAFQQVSAVARQTGVDVETTTGALTGLALAGLKGADAGTSLRTFLLRLTPTTKQAQEYMDALGISYDKNKTIGSQLGSVLDQLNASTSVLNETQKTQVLTQIFGQDAIRAATILVRDGSAGLRENTEAANQNGAANRLAQANAKGLSGAFNGLKSNLDTLGITLGEIVSGPMESMVRALGNIAAGATVAADALSKINFPDLPKVPAWAKFLGLTALGPAGQTFGLEAALIARLGQAPGPDGFETPAAKKARLERARVFNPFLKGALAGKLDVLPGEELYPKPTKAAPLSPAAAAAVKARVAALEKKRRKARPADTEATNALQIDQLNAQLSGSLQAELAANKAVETYFENRLKLAVKGTDRYVLILGALQNANAATQSVQDQINAEAKSAADKRKADAEEAKRIAEKEKNDAAQAARDLLTLQMSVLDLAVQRADYTENKIDDVTSRRKKIKVIDDRIKTLQAIKKKTTAEKQQLVDLRKARLDVLAEIKGLNDDAKSGGFSLSDLFAATTQIFRDYASNVSSSPTTPGAATNTLFAARGAQFLAARGKLTDADKAKLEKMRETNTLLYDIWQAVLPGPPVAATEPIYTGGFTPGWRPKGWRPASNARTQTKVIPN